MGVFKRNRASVFALLAFFALTIPALAKPVRTTIQLTSPATVSGTQLNAGEYSVQADDTKIAFYRSGKMIAEAKVEWKDEASKPGSNSVLTDSGSVKEIHFAGKKRYAVVL